MGRKKRRQLREQSLNTNGITLRQAQNGLKDVSIQEFADKRGNLTNRSNVRESKANTICFQKNIDRLAAPANSVFDIAEDYSDDANDTIDGPNVLDVDDDDVDQPIILSKTMTLQSAQPSSSSSEESDSIRYPPIVWRLIADYILPEDVSRFGAICWDSYAVVNSPSFWLRMYSDFYSVDRAGNEGKRVDAYEVMALPEDLIRPTADYRTREVLLIGLKNKVIRLLYHRYRPFVSRLYSPQNSVPNPHALVGLHCLEASCEKASSASKNAFKFRLRFGRLEKRLSLWQLSTKNDHTHTETFTGLPLVAVKQNEPVIKNSWEDMNDEEDEECCTMTWQQGAVNPNVIFDPHPETEKDSCVLLAETATLSILPDDFLGLRLQSCTLTLSGQSFQYRKLALNFAPYQLRSTQTSSELITVTINDIIRLKLVHWFHPSHRKV